MKRASSSQTSCYFLGPLHNQSCCQWQRTLASQHNSSLMAVCGRLWVKFFLGAWPNPSICHDSQNDLQNEDNLARSAASRLQRNFQMNHRAWRKLKRSTLRMFYPLLRLAAFAVQEVSPCNSELQKASASAFLGNPRFQLTCAPGCDCVKKH